jgi:hypothetical protein
VDAVGLSPVIAAPSDRRSGSPIQDSRQSRDLYEPPILIRVKAATTRRMECLALLNLQFHSRQAIIRTEITVDLTSVASAHTFFSGNGVFSLAILSQSRDDTRLQYGNIQMIIPNKIMPSNHLEELCWLQNVCVGLIVPCIMDRTLCLATSTTSLLLSRGPLEHGTGS